MNDRKKKKEELIRELVSLRRRIQKKEKSETVYSRATEEQQDSEEKYKALIETTDTGYLISDSEGKVVDANREYVRLSGRTGLNEILGRSLIEWTAEHDRERNKAEVAKCLGKGFVRGLEIDYVDKKGRITPIEIQATVIRKGPSLSILSLCRDITERRKTINALRHSEEKLSKAFRVSPDWMTIATRDEARFIDVNDSFLRMTGYTRDEVIGRTTFEINLWKDVEDRRKGLEILEKTGHLANFEVKFRMKSGKIRDMLWSAELFELEGRKCILSVCHDITERKRIENALRLSEEKYQLLVDNANEGIMVCQDLRIQFANPRAAEITGYAPEELILKPLLELVHPDDHEIVRERTAKRLRGEFVQPINIYKGLRKNGQTHWIEMNAAANSWEGRPAVLYFFQDITEIKKAREELLKAKEELERRVDERTAVLHEVNEKLQSELTERKRVEEALKKSEKKLRLLSDQLIHAQEKERKRISIELHDDLGQSLVGLKFQLCNLPKKLRQDQEGLKTIIEKALKNLDEMTEKVRRLSKDLRPAVLEHLGLFEALQWLFEDASSNYRIKIINDLKNSKYSFSKEQEINLFRIFQEALTNIGKHAKAARVTIAMTQNEKESVFTIKDDGRGFDPKAVMNKNPSEIGLGLAAMDERIRLTGGTLNIKSEIGRGTMITFTVPTGKKK